MASATKVYKARNHMKDRKAGLDRKKKINKEGSTPSREEFFGDKNKK